MTKIQELVDQAKDIIYDAEMRGAHENQLLEIIDELAGIAEAPLVVNTIKDIPTDNNGGYSDDYLIDLDGRRKDFAIGYYVHQESRWIIKDDDLRILFRPDHMTWQRLPLAKYDNEK